MPNIKTSQEVDNMRVYGQHVTITSAAAGPTGSIDNTFYGAKTLCYQVSCGVSANNAQIQGSIDGTNFYTLKLVSGVGVVSGTVNGNYSAVRGNVDTYSSGTVQFDFIGLY